MNCIRLHLCLLFAAFTSISCFAQYKVEGRCIDVSNAEPVPGALCKVFANGDSINPAVMMVTDDNGYFNQSLPSSGEYALTVTFLGLSDKTVNFIVSDKHPEANLGTVAMDASSTELGEVTVTVKKPVIQANGERVTYNMEEDPQSKTSTVMEMLRKVPLVTVDGQDNIKVNGQSSFKIYINGKENPMLNANAKEVLKSMPATAIKKIEVITEPGAKYDAEGVGGILNIVTQGSEATTDGYLLTLKAGASNTDTSESVYALTQIGKVTASVNYNFHKEYNSRDFIFDFDRVIKDNEGLQTMLSHGVQSQKNTFQSGNIDLSWEPDSLNLFNVSGNLMYGRGNNPMLLTQSLYRNETEKLWSYGNNQYNEWKWGNISASASYQHSFGDKERNIVFSYLYNHGLFSDKSSIEYTDMDGYMAEYPFIRTDMDNPTNTHTIQLDYTNPFNSHHKLETGAKAIFRRNSSRGATYQGTSADDMKPAQGNTDLKQFQDVAAIYASYGGEFGKWNVKGGLRYEYTHMGVNFINKTMPDYSSSLNDVVPNAAVSFNISPMSSLRLAYQMRISRPAVSQLNPYRDVSNPINVTYGNPDLTSERNNNISLTYSNFTSGIGMNFVLSYFRNSNSICQYSYIDGITQYETYANAGNFSGFSLNGYMNFNLVRNLQWSLYCGVSYNDFKFSKMNIFNSGWSGNAMLNVTWQMPADIRMDLYGGVGSNGPQLQSSSTFYNFYSVSLSRAFLKDKRLEVTLNASNFLGPMKIKTNQWNDNSTTHFKVKIPVQSFGVSVTYRFGGLSTDVKKVATQIVNDDVEQSKGGGNAISK